MLQIIAACTLLIFVALMIGVAFYSKNRATNMHSFLLGGRNIGAWLSAFAYATSYFSAVIFIGYAGKTGWQVGIGGIWIGIGNALIGCLLGWLLLAKRTRKMTNILGSATMPEFFEARYSSKNMKIYSALIIFIFLVPYCATVYKGLGYLFSQVFPVFNNLIPGINAEIYIMFIIAVLTAVYLIPGGYIATAITDFIQGIIMIAGVVVMVYMVVSHDIVGGLSSGFSKLAAIDMNLVSAWGGKNFNFLVMNILLTSLGALGLPQMIHKFYAIKDEKSIVRAATVSTIFAIIIGIGAYLVGSFGRLYLNNQLPDGSNYDMIVPQMLTTALSSGLFSYVIFSVILLLVLSASMSTLSSIVLTSSSAIAVDLLGAVKKNVDEKKQMKFMRYLCFLFILLSFIFASFKIAFIMQLMSFSWGIVAGSFIGPYIWGLYSKKITKVGAWSGLLSGLVVVGGTTLYLVLANPQGAAAGFEIAKNLSQTLGVTAMLSSLVAVPVVSAFTNRLDKKIVEKAFPHQNSIEV